MSGHLTGEQLSEAVDGLAGPDTTSHLENCPSCAARLEAWRGVVDGLAQPIAVPDDRREAAVGAALAAVGGASDDAGPGPRLIGTADPRPPAAGPAGRQSGAVRRLAAGRPAALGVAAGLLLVAGLGIGLGVELSSGSHHGSQTAAPPALRGSGPGGPSPVPAASAGGSQTAAGSTEGAASSALAPAVPAVDLGSLSGPQALAAAVDRALVAARSLGAAASGGGVGGGSGAPGISATAGPSSPPATTARPPAAQSPSSVPSTLQPVATPTQAACPLPPGVFPATAQPVLILEATAVYRSRPARVLVYQLGSSRRALVLAAGNCSLVAQVPV